jgi:response regulator RpfG family c-di-GMP phosphodiesterase
MAEDGMLGKTLSSVIGANEARRFEPANREAMATSKTLVRIHRIDDADSGEGRVLQSEHVPLPAEPGVPGRVLMVVQNITDLIRQREKAERIMRQTVDTLVSVVDRRDPFSAHYSSRAAQVAGAIVEEMALDPVEGQTVEIAAELMNLGKILVPMELLTSDRKLTNEELRQVRESILTRAELIEGIEFEGPVVETLRQMLETWDGSGMPRGLAGEDILRSSRIVAVANSFVGLVSARAYREGMEFDKAIDILLEESGGKFDRRVVSALMNHVDNKGGRERWAQYRERPSDAPGGDED